MSNETLTEVEARRLANDIRSNLQNLEENLKRFHAMRGWLPLGYDSFTVWWDNEMSDLPIANGIRNWAIYEMIRENTDPGTKRLRTGLTAVMAHATGVAPTTITAMTSRARQRVRWTGRKDTDPATLTMVIPTLWHRHLMALSSQKDRSMADLIRPLLKEGMMRTYGIDMDSPLYEQ